MKEQKKRKENRPVREYNEVYKHRNRIVILGISYKPRDWSEGYEEFQL